MDQNSAQAILLMARSFPQTIPTDGLLSIYDESLQGVTDDAIQATVKRYLAGLVEGHNKSFAPSVAEFAAEARGVQSKMPARRDALPAPVRQLARNPTHDQWKEERRREGRKIIAERKANGDPIFKPRAQKP